MLGNHFALMVLSPSKGLLSLNKGKIFCTISTGRSKPLSSWFFIRTINWGEKKTERKKHLYVLSFTVYVIWALVVKHLFVHSWAVPSCWICKGSVIDLTPPISQEFVSIMLPLGTCSEHQDLIWSYIKTDGMPRRENWLPITFNASIGRQVIIDSYRHSRYCSYSCLTAWFILKLPCCFLTWVHYFPFSLAAG